MSSLVKVNGEPGEDFRFAKSVRQGCPLTPYLFILAMDVLGHILDDPKHEIEGLHLPKGGCVWDQTFMDDTAFYLKGSSNYSALFLGQKSIWANSQPCGLARKKRNGNGDKKLG